MDTWQLNLRHLRAAAEICARGSVSRAAAAVSLTQPAVTQGISRLERQLTQPLFERTPEGMDPLPAARTFSERIVAALDHIASPRVTMAQMRALIAFADAGSYAGAAAISGLSQPSLHRAINDLGLSLRRTLLERRGKGVALTEAGKRTVRAFRLARAELDAGLAELEGLKGRETGRIVIGAMPLSRARLLPTAAAAFYAKHPEVALSIVEGSYLELVDPLRDGEIDMMIGAVRDPAPGPDLVQVPLFRDRPVIVGRRGHPLARLAADSRDGHVLPQMARFPWIVAGPGTPLRMQWERMFTGGGVEPPAVPIECGSVITIREILTKSDFLTLLSPDQVSVEIEAGWLEVLHAAPAGLLREIGLTTRANWRPTMLQQAFVNELHQQAQ